MTAIHDSVAAIVLASSLGVDDIATAKPSVEMTSAWGVPTIVSSPSVPVIALAQRARPVIADANGGGAARLLNQGAASGAEASAGSDARSPAGAEGSRTRKRVQPPGTLSTSTEPPMPSASCFTIARPSPVPTGRSPP